VCVVYGKLFIKISSKFLYKYWRGKMTQKSKELRYGCALEGYKDTLTRRVYELEYGDDTRNHFEHDRDKIIFSRAFRRLSAKTQIVTAYGKVTSDHLRSRLTHSLEVVQIAKSIAKYVNSKLEEDLLNYDLIEAIALGHDIGHTPFGHVGEEALFKFMFAYDGENGEYKKDILKSINKKEYNFNKLRHCFQSIKLCCFLEKHYCPNHYGLNLTLATLDGIFKHSNLDSYEMKFYKAMFESYIESFYNGSSKFPIDTMKKIFFDYQSPVTYEGIIVAIADEIAQLSHDIEDIRRITEDKDEIKKYYRKDVIESYNYVIKDIEYNDISIKKILEDLKEEIEKDDNKLYCEYLHAKLIISLAVYAIGEYILRLIDTIKKNGNDILKECNLGEFKNILNCVEKDKIELDERYRLVIEFLNNLSVIKHELTICIFHPVQFYLSQRNLVYP
jgi:dGTPase